MKKMLVAAIALFMVGITAPALAGVGDMQVYTWDTPTCEHTMTTNHFVLEPGETAAVQLQQGTCDAHEGVLFFGYKTGQKNSKPLTSRDNVLLTVVDNTGLEAASASGSLFMAGEASSCTLYAQNTSRNKSIKVRLRAATLW
jgi:hypothetical protein